MDAHKADVGHEGAGSYIPLQAVKLLSNVKDYGDAIGKAVRHIADYTPKQLEEKKIMVKGKLNAEGLWAYINHVADGALGKYHFDAKDPSWKASYDQINAVVKRFGTKGVTTDLLEAVIGQYGSTAIQYAGEKDRLLVASVPTDQGKTATGRIADAIGKGVIYGPWIKQATSPTEVAQAKASLEPTLRETVNEAKATGTLSELEKKLAA